MKTLMSLTVVTAVVTAVATASLLGATQAAPVPARPLKIVALGDSLTSGRGVATAEAYPAVLQRMLRAEGLPFTMVNYGEDSDTTAAALRRLPRALSEEPAILIVALGANDGLRGVPIAQVRANLETIVETAQALTIPVLLCGMDALPVHGWQYTLDFHNIFPAVAAKYDVPLVPFLLDGVFANQAMLQPDFAHPNAAGAAQIARTIWPYLQPLAATLLSRQ